MSQAVSDFPSRFRKLLEIRKWTNVEAAERLNVSRQTISAWATGVRKPKSPMIAHIASITGVSYAWLNGWDSDMSASSMPNLSMLPVTRRRVPILGAAACGTPIYKPGDGAEYIDINNDCPCDFALIAQGDSMTGDRIHDGDIVFCRAQDDVEDGQIAAVSVDDEVCIKRIKRLRNANGEIYLTQLLSSNPAYDSIDIGGSDETRIVRIFGHAIAFKALLP